MASGSALQQQAFALEAQIRTLVNNDLKEICRSEGLPVSGVKATLQNRITSVIRLCVAEGNTERFNRIRQRAFNHGHHPAAQAHPAPAMQSPLPPSAPQPFGMANSFGAQMAARVPQPSPRPRQYSTRLMFKESPFFEILEPLINTLDLQVTPSHRTTSQASIQLAPETVSRLKNDPSLRVMLYCAGDVPLNLYSRIDIAFPQNLEVKVNGADVKWNFKGLKNKPGTTRPADITEFVRKIPHSKNSLSITYALTQKKFHVVVNLVKKHSVEELTDRIRRGNVISKDQVLREMLRKADDPDIVATSTVMSLKDPVSTLRIDLPIRSAVCNHNSCFDATSFLQLQEQAPTWTCPLCNKTVSFEGLSVDQYVQEILQSTPRSVDQVTIEPNGTWSAGGGSKTPAKSGSSNAAGHDSDSDDLVEISDFRVKTIKAEASDSPFSMIQSPNFSRETSALATPGSTSRGTNSNNKRPAEVIDLTLSDDDEPPQRPNKRLYNPPPGPQPPDVPSRTNGFPPRAPSVGNTAAHPRHPNGISPFRPPMQPRPHGHPLPTLQPQPQPQQSLPFLGPAPQAPGAPSRYVQYPQSSSPPYGNPSW